MLMAPHPRVVRRRFSQRKIGIHKPEPFHKPIQGSRSLDGRLGQAQLLSDLPLRHAIGLHSDYSLAVGCSLWHVEKIDH
jgi:hypothetical protein